MDGYGWLDEVGHVEFGREDLRQIARVVRVDTCELEREDLPRGFDVVDLFEKLGVEAVETGDEAFRRKTCCVCCSLSIPCDMLLYVTCQSACGHSDADCSRVRLSSRYVSLSNLWIARVLL